MKCIICCWEVIVRRYDLVLDESDEYFSEDEFENEFNYLGYHTFIDEKCWCGYNHTT